MSNLSAGVSVLLERMKFNESRYDSEQLASIVTGLRLLERVVGDEQVLFYTVDEINFTGGPGDKWGVAVYTPTRKISGVLCELEQNGYPVLEFHEVKSEVLPVISSVSLKYAKRGPGDSLNPAYVSVKVQIVDEVFTLLGNNPDIKKISGTPFTDPFELHDELVEVMGLGRP